MAIIPPKAVKLEKELLAWAMSSWNEGCTILRKERVWNEIPNCIQYVNGEQMPVRSQAISRIVDNRILKIVEDTVSALTDVRPIWNYETNNDAYKDQGDILSKLARGWWRTNAIDRRLQSVLSYSCVGGSGYAVLAWDKDLPGGGDFRLVPYDPRDVVPIGPIYSDSIQDWRGVILRERLPVETVREMFPSKRAEIVPQAGNQHGTMVGANNTALITNFTSAITGRGDQKDLPDSVDLFRIFVKDESLNTGDSSIQMGPPETNYSYVVHPLGEPIVDANGQIQKFASREDAKMYPRGRFIMCTNTTILHDGPNPYWHGMFPVVRFTLDPLPWTLLGSSMVLNLIPLQNAYNECLRGIEDGIGQWVRRGIVADSTAISKTNLNALDTRRAGLRASLNPTAGEGFKILDGPTFPNWYMEMLAYYKMEMDEVSGVRGMQQLTQLKQMPSEGTMEKYLDAMSPQLRLRSRSIEISLSELAEMLKVGFFQYYTMERRMQILGPDGQTLEDFDFDPETLIPAALPGATREQRADLHHKNFTFAVAPNSFLNVSHMQQKMMMLQLLRAQLVDPWTAWDTFDVPNVGKAPAETVPERIIAARKLGLLPGPTPEMVQAQEMMAIFQAQQVMAQMAMMANVMPGGPQAAMQQQQGNTSGVGPQGGRPPSGQQPPQFVNKSDGRTVVSESGT